MGLSHTGDYAYLVCGVVAVGIALVGVAGGSCTAALAVVWMPACPDLGGSPW